MLKLQNISVSFGSNLILKNISCLIEQGDFIVIVGTNGSGKTTFFDTLAGRIKPTQGTIYLNTQDITHTHEQERALYISRLFQNPLHNCISSLTVEQNIAIASYKGRTVTLHNGLRASHNSAIKKHIELFSFDLQKFKDRTMAELSGGQRQLISFIMATLTHPQLLLLDESTAALDPAAATNLLLCAAQYIKQHAITALLITHDPYIALNIGNKLWVLDEGRIVKQYNHTEKRNIQPNDLIGHINYQALAQVM